MMDITQRLIPAKLTNTRPGIKMTPKFITIHETDNPGKGADAEAHAKLQEGGNSRTASWHLQVDKNHVIQSIPFNEVAWAAGDGRNGPGNSQSIHLEMCVNADGDYYKTIQNTVEVVKYLMQRFNIPVDRVVQHNHWTGKNCPSRMRKEGLWNSFKQQLSSAKDGWRKDATTSVWYYYEDDKKRIGWLFDDGKWYYLHEDNGSMVTGWYEVARTWYYFNKSGVMQTGWLRSSGKWYYLDHNGKMVIEDREIDGEKYKFDSKGAWIQ